MNKGQISMDFILSLVIFLVVISIVFGFVNDFETNNNKIVDFYSNYDAYLKIRDYYLSSKYFDDFNVSIDLNYSNCFLTNIDGNLVIGSKDNNFTIKGFPYMINNKPCNGTFKVK